MTKYILFTGTDCHLCDVAKQLIKEQTQGSLDITEINVKVERDYFHNYGARIPVLKNTQTGNELGWPFDQHTLMEYLQSC